MMVKKDYENLKLRVFLDCEDVITASSNENGYDLGNDNDFWSFVEGFMGGNQ